MEDGGRLSGVWMRDNGVMIRTREQQEAWLAQWTGAAVAPRAACEGAGGAVRRAGAQAADPLLALADPARLDAARRYSSGLVEQQALFHRRGRT